MKKFEEIPVLTGSVAMTEFDEYKDGKCIVIGYDYFHQPAQLLGRIRTSEYYDRNMIVFASNKGVEFFHTSKFRVLCTKDASEAEKWESMPLAKFIYELGQHLKKNPISCGSNIVSGCWDHLDEYKADIIEVSKEKGLITIFDASHWLVFKITSMGTFGGHATIDVEVCLPDESEVHDYPGYKSHDRECKMKQPLSTWLNVKVDKDYSYALCESMGWDY